MMQMETVMPISLCLFIMIFECKSSQPFFLFPFFWIQKIDSERHESWAVDKPVRRAVPQTKTPLPVDFGMTWFFPAFFLILIIRQVFATNGLKAMRGCNMWAKKDIPTWVFLKVKKHLILRLYFIDLTQPSLSSTSNSSLRPAKSQSLNASPRIEQRSETNGTRRSESWRLSPR